GQLSRTHTAMALVLERRSDDLASLEHATKALELARRPGHRLWEAESLNLAGWYLARLGKLDAARDWAEQAHAAFLGLNDRGGKAASWDPLGYIATASGRHDDAIDYFRQAIELYDEEGNVAVVAGLHERLGRAHLGLGDRAEARRAWQRALAQYRSLR